MHQGRLGLGDYVQLVVSDPLWPTGKMTPSHSLVCQSLPAKAWRLAWLTGLASFIGQEGRRAEKQEQRRQQTSPSWFSCPRHRAWLAGTVPQPGLARTLAAPASQAVQTAPGNCAVVCGHRVCSRHLPPVPKITTVSAERQ